MGLDTAKVHNGKAIVAYVGDQAVDADGNVIEGAPKPSKDTEPSEQLGGRADMNTEERSASIMANAFAKALAQVTGAAAPRAAAPEVESDDEEDGEADESLPSIPDMEAHLAGIDDVDEIKSMQKKDTRKGAKPLYKARLAELNGE